ncbi:MAG: hypothetical protein VX619_12235 [bacterium]|nr:hypothetical protein [bacterium]
MVRENNLSLFYTTIAVNKLKLSFDESPQLIKKFQSNPDYNKLLQNIRLEGVLDPCLVQAYPDRLQVETGCQRLMVARDLNLNSLVCFVYPWQGGRVEGNDLDLFRITSINQIKNYFRNESVACYLDIMGYLDSGRIQL